MNNIRRVARRNNITGVVSRRHSLASLISESYQTLYNCELDSPIYKLAQSLIESIQEDPTDIDSHSEDLETLKRLQDMGDEADLSDEEVKDEVLEDEEYIEDEPLEEPPAEVEESEEEFVDVPAEDEVPLEEPSMDESEDEEDMLTPEELEELRKHLKEMRASKMMAESKSHKKSRSWDAEMSSMSTALKSFRESSSKKAFFRSLNKLAPRLQAGADPLTIQESINLYKSTNSAMTHLAVELEHNPGFIYTFRECTRILSKDNASLLECISNRKVPSATLVDSFRKFANIVLESEEFDYEKDEEEIIEGDGVNLEKEEERDVIDEGDGVNLEKEEERDVIDEGDGVNLPKEEERDVIDENDGVNLEKEEERDVIDENDGVNLPKEEERDVIDENDGVNLEKEEERDVINEEEEASDEEETLLHEESEDEEEVLNEEDPEDDEISDEEAAELKRYLQEMRKSKSKK